LQLKTISEHTDNKMFMIIYSLDIITSSFVLFPARKNHLKIRSTISTQQTEPTKS
jgi:hypothetical protein